MIRRAIVRADEQITHVELSLEQMRAKQLRRHCGSLKPVCSATDTERLDWLERNLMHIAHDRTTCSVDMSGRCVHGQLVNEARGANGGPSYFRVNHRSIREAIDAAMSNAGTQP